MRFLTFTSLTTFESCESRDNEIVTDILTTPNTLRENSHGCHGIVNTLRDSVVTIVTDRIFTVCFDPYAREFSLSKSRDFRVFQTRRKTLPFL